MKHLNCIFKLTRRDAKALENVSLQKRFLLVYQFCSHLSPFKRSLLNLNVLPEDVYECLRFKNWRGIDSLQYSLQDVQRTPHHPADKVNVVSTREYHRQLKGQILTLLQRSFDCFGFISTEK